MRKLRVTMFVLMVASICARPGARRRLGGGRAVDVRRAKVVDFGFDPVESSVDVGTTVTWTNNGARPHTVTDRGGTFDTGPVSPGANASDHVHDAGTLLLLLPDQPVEDERRRWR